jgi:hypothetical protein
MGSGKKLEAIAALTAIGGWLVIAPGSYAQLNCNAGVEFYPHGGDIQRCILNGEHTLYTGTGLKVTCANGRVLEQYPEGALRSCTIEKFHSFDGVRCEPPAEVTFQPDGRLRSCGRL